MLRVTLVSVLAIAMLATPAQLIAGGPARLCLPINEVTEKNSKECSNQIKDFLGDRASDVRMQKHKGQWYATIWMREDIQLKDVHDALENSSFSVPSKKLILIGPAQLSIKVRTKYLKGFFEELAAIKGLKIDEQAKDGSNLLITINRSKLVRDLNDSAKKKEDFPSYDAIKKLLDGHNADLEQVRWNSRWHCQGIFGCKVEPNNQAKDKVAGK